MKKLLLLALVIGLAFAELHLWNTALVVGEQRYKNSHRIYMALKSAYHLATEIVKQEDLMIGMEMANKIKKHNKFVPY